MLFRSGPPAPKREGRDEEGGWKEIQEAFTLDRTMINLNNGGCSPTPRVVHEAYKRYLDISNQAPPYFMWQVLEPGIEAIRRDLARFAGCDPEELAITRNASEALQTAQLGIELAPGDEVVTTDQDYPRMLDTWEQRAKRSGITIKKVKVGVPATADQLISAVTTAFSPRTKVVHISHLTFLTGQTFPVAEICAAARQKGIVSIVDGAHAFAHLPFRLADLGCDYYGTSLHKWLLAPVGTGFLFMRRDRVAKTAALQPTNPSKDNDIRKFEEIGTHPAAAHNAIAEALAFHLAIGSERKIQRLRQLRSRWWNRLQEDTRIRLLTPAGPDEGGAIATFSIEGKKASEITTWLWDKRRIFVTPIVTETYEGVRVTPNVYTTSWELDVFCDAVKDFLKG